MLLLPRDMYQSRCRQRHFEIWWFFLPHICILCILVLHCPQHRRAFKLYRYASQEATRLAQFHQIGGQRGGQCRGRRERAVLARGAVAFGVKLDGEGFVAVAHGVFGQAAA